MATAYTPILKLALPVTGELNGTWGTTVNDNITSMVEQAITGLAAITTWTAASHTLTTANGTTDEARCAVLECSGAPGAAATVICPALSKVYIIKNSVTGGYAVTLKTSAGSGISVPNGSTALLYCDGTNVVSGANAFTTLTNTGTAYLGGASGNQSLQVDNVASAVNYLAMSGNTTGNSPVIYAAGVDANVSVTYSSKGANGHYFQTNSFASNQFAVTHTASAVNYLYVTGAATGSGPIFSAQGSDTNIPINYAAKGNSSHFFYSGSAPQFVVGGTTSAVNYLQAVGAVLGAAPAFSAQGTDTNINVSVAPKGTGLFTLGDSTLPTGTTVLLNALFSSDTAVGNVFNVRKSAATTAGANIGAFRSRGTAAVPTALASGDNISSFLSLGFDGTNYLATSSIVTGVDGVVSAGVMPGRISFLTNNGTSNAERGRVDSVGNWTLGGASGANSLRVAVVASAVNHVDVQGAVTGSGPVIQVAGSDTNASLTIGSKGTSPLYFATARDLGFTPQFAATHTASAVNYVQVTGGATGSAPAFSAQGTDTNVDFKLNTQGTGVLQFGTYTAGIIAQAGYITIKDAGGTTRRLLVG